MMRSKQNQSIKHSKTDCYQMLDGRSFLIDPKEAILSNYRSKSDSGHKCNIPAAVRPPLGLKMAG